MGTITINELLKACQHQVKLGNGDRKVMLSGDDEGNSYHECFFLFSPEVKGKDIMYGLPVSPAEFDKDYILLG